MMQGQKTGCQLDRSVTSSACEYTTMDGRCSCNHLFILHTIVNSGSGGGGGRRGGGRRGGGGGDGGGGGGRKIVLLHGGY